MITIAGFGDKQDLRFSGNNLRELGTNAANQFKDGRVSAGHIAQACGHLVKEFLTPISESSTIDRVQKVNLFSILSSRSDNVFQGILGSFFTKAVSPSFLDLIKDGNFTQWQPLEDACISESMRLGDLSIRWGNETYKLSLFTANADQLNNPVTVKDYTLRNEITCSAFELGKADEATQKLFESKFAEVSKGK